MRDDIRAALAELELHDVAEAITLGTCLASLVLAAWFFLAP